MFLNCCLVSLESFYAPFVLILENMWLLLLFNIWPELKAERLSTALHCCIVSGIQRHLSNSLREMQNFLSDGAAWLRIKNSRLKSSGVNEGDLSKL